MMKDFMPQTLDEVSYFLVYMFTQLTVSGLIVILETTVLYVHHQDEGHEQTGREASNSLENYSISEKSICKRKSCYYLSENTGCKIKAPKIRSQTLDKIFCILVTVINLTSLAVYLMLIL
jgi:hypothetical protein